MGIFVSLGFFALVGWLAYLYVQYKNKEITIEADGSFTVIDIP